VVVWYRRSEESGEHDLKCGLLQFFEDFDSAVRTRCLVLGARTMSYGFFNEAAGVLLEHWAELSDMLGVKIGIHVLPASYMVCPIAHH
jgi:hypothetical protein